MKSKVEIICEIGINHNGNMELAREMVWVAKACGADIAKFQIYDPVELLDPNHPDLKEHWEIILATKLSCSNVGMLKEECDKAGIEFMASVFTPEAVEWTEEVGMQRYKIASRSIYNYDLAEAVAATGKPVIVSYGMAKKGKKAAIEVEGVGELRRLYCVSKYPTPLEDVKFMDHWGRNIFGVGKYFGFSDHTEGIAAAVVAMTLGARIIEKHFTVDKNLPGPDHICSITPDELRTLCELRDGIGVITDEQS